MDGGISLRWIARATSVPFDLFHLGFWQKFIEWRPMGIDWVHGGDITGREVPNISH